MNSISHIYITDFFQDYIFLDFKKENMIIHQNNTVQRIFSMRHVTHISSLQTKKYHFYLFKFLTAYNLKKKLKYQLNH
jgi:hypothetical protein